MKMQEVDLSIIFPCRNEEKALLFCLRKTKKIIEDNGINAEIIVSDSSVDRSPEIARREGVRLVKHDKVGYGNAYLEGIRVAKGKYILMVDADCTYDFEDIPKFLFFLKEGYDMVVGNRFGKKMDSGAMSFSHRYIGNPILSGVLRLLFNAKIRDAHCGIRAIKRDALRKLDLHTTGMEFASEMIIKATKKKLKIKEFPVNYYKRIGDSKLKTTSDGWRHLRFMLLHSPSFLFFFPGMVLFLIGFFTMFALFLEPINMFDLTFYVHPMFVSSSMVIIGYQLVFFSVFAKSYLINHLGEAESPVFKKLYEKFTLETGFIISFLFIILGGIVYLLILGAWVENNFGELNQIKNSIVALTLVVVGVQTLFNSFMLSIISIREI
jgi:glycosyltransferase involved in cell wall biosynthesis